MPVLVLPRPVINSQNCHPDNPSKKDIIRVCCQCATKTIGHLDWCNTRIGYVPRYPQEIWCLHEPCDEDTMGWSKTEGKKVLREHGVVVPQGPDGTESNDAPPGPGPAPGCAPASASGSESTPEPGLFTLFDAASSGSSHPDQGPSGPGSKADQASGTSAANPGPAAPQTTGFLPLTATEGPPSSVGAPGASVGRPEGSQSESFLQLSPLIGARAQMQQQTHDEHTSEDGPPSQGKTSTISDLLDLLSLSNVQNRSFQLPCPADAASPGGGPATVDDIPDLWSTASTSSTDQTPSTPTRERESAEDSAVTQAQPTRPVSDLPRTSGPSKASLKTTPVNQEHRRHQHHHKKPVPKGRPGNMFGALGSDDDDGENGDEEA